MLNFRKTKLNRWLKDKNIEPIIGATPMLFGEGRPAEVLYWLDTYRSNETNEGGKILGWCFLDECDALDADGIDTIGQPAQREKERAERFQGKFCRVDLEKGLTKEIADDVIECIRNDIGTHAGSSYRMLKLAESKSRSSLDSESEDSGSSSSESDEFESEYPAS